MISIDDSTFINSFEDFKRILVPLENKQRAADNLPPLTEDEETNLFLELRKKHALPSKDSE